MPWTWRARPEAARPQAALAWGPAARRLHARLAAIAQTAPGRLQATANRDVLMVFGAADELPWVEGVEYAAVDERAPQLWLPTSREPQVPLDLLARALTARFARSPLLLWPEPAAVVPLDRQLPLTEAWLLRVNDYWEGRDAFA